MQMHAMHPLPPCDKGASRTTYESGRRGSNSRPLAWKANALSTELLPQLRRNRAPQRRDCPQTSKVWWGEMDSNHRRYKPADLQSAPFGHSGIFPNFRTHPPLRASGALQFALLCLPPLRSSAFAPLRSSFTFRPPLAFSFHSPLLRLGCKCEPMEGFEPPTS